VPKKILIEPQQPFIARIFKKVASLFSREAITKEIAIETEAKEIATTLYNLLLKRYDEAFGSENPIALYELFNEMINTTPILNRALSIYTSETLSGSIWSNIPALASYKFRAQLAKAVEDMLKYGDGYLLCGRDPNNIIHIPTMCVAKTTDGYRISTTQIQENSLRSFTIFGPDIRPPALIGREKENTEMVLPDISNPLKQSSPDETTSSPGWTMANFKWRTRTSNPIYGAGLLDELVNPWQEYRAVLLSLVFTRLLSTPERYMIIVDGKLVDNAQLNAYLEEIRTTFSKTYKAISDGGEVDLAKLPQILAMSERIVLPIRGGIELRIEPIPAPHFEDIEDVLHLHENLVIGLGIPINVLTGKELPGEMIKQQNSIFAGEINNIIQNGILPTMEKVAAHYGNGIWAIINKRDAYSPEDIDDMISIYNKLVESGVPASVAIGISGLKGLGISEKILGIPSSSQKKMGGEELRGGFHL
jgi:hypothetical protein